MGIRGKKPAAPEKSLWRGLWSGCGQGRSLFVLSPLSLLSTDFVHRFSTAVEKAYPSVIFLRISSMLRLNSESSCIMVSIRPQAEMAVV